MRLLHFDSLDRLILTNFRGKEIPPYAILSHRWSDSEIFIEDIATGMYKEKEGYKKLMFCAEQAARDELQYFWIDTCCIDRWNNNERSTAINSMFLWYKNATKCYVFLPDLSVSTETELVQRSDWEASFSSSAWFTRGWTLQELIAPVSVEFFSRQGTRIGDKISLHQLLHTITGIPLAALCNCPLDQFSISERMRWAEHRVTTEEEDKVYCLLGLLGISVPATYGEGQKSALERLQAEIHSVNSNAPSIIPFSRNKAFAGREPQLAELETKLFSKKESTTTLAIVGPGGTGKSQLALEVAHRARQDKTDCAVFWMDASDKDSLHQSYAGVAQKLSIPGWDSGDLADTKQVVKHCVAELSKRQCLLVFDNIDDITSLFGGSLTTDGADLLADYLPQSTRCSVIFTTTSTQVAKTLAPQHVITLDELTPDVALRMLQNSLLRSLSTTEQEQSVDLLRGLSHLPIAIVQAAACMSASKMTVQEYATQLDKHKSVLSEYNSELPEHRFQDSSLGSPIAATLSVSISQILYRNAIATDYLFFTACVHRKDIALDLLEAPSLWAREDNIKLLDEYKLITRRPAKSALDVHRLVHDALRARLEAQEQLQYWTQRTIARVAQVFPEADYSNRSKWRRLLPHALYALSYSQADNNDEKTLDLVWKCALSLNNDGRYKEAEELFLQVIQANTRVLGAEHPDTLTSISHLVTTYRNQGHLDKAAELNLQVLHTRKRVLSDEHPDTLTSMANLACAYSDQGLWDKAEKLQLRVMHTHARVLGDEHPGTLASMGNLAFLYSKQEHWDKAEELGLRVMHTRARVLGDEHPDTLASMHELAFFYSDQGLWDKAEELELQVVQTRARVLGDEHPDTLASMGNLASTYLNQGHWGKAEKLQLQVMQTRTRVLGDSHPDTLTSMSNLAVALHSQARQEEALAMMERCFQSRQRILGRQHPDTLLSLNALSSWQVE